MAGKWWFPTRKWFTLLATGVADIAGAWLITGAFDELERGMAAALLSSLATTWAVPNAKTVTRERIKRKVARRAKAKDPATLEGGSSHMRGS